MDRRRGIELGERKALINARLTSLGRWAPILPLAAAIAVVGLVTPAWATQVDMEKLPKFATFGCANCHGGPGASVSDAGEDPQSLTLFGQDWDERGRTWSEILALLDSDLDGCNNGFEMGDPSGIWRDSEPHLQGEQSGNPGLADCTPSAVDDGSWGLLKSVFDSGSRKR